MHEMAVVAGVLDSIAERSEGRRVVRVVLEIGRMTAVLPDAVRFCFDVAARGTEAEGAALDIVEIDGAIRCRSCGKDGPADFRLALCTCGSADVVAVRGAELRVREMEVV
jgi:hydrogenase nickel incorporation protein HypA/HybF